MGSDYTVEIKQSDAIVAMFEPQTLSPGTFAVGPFDLSAIPGRRWIAKILVGALGSGGTVDFKLEYGASSGGDFFDIDPVYCAIHRITAASSIATLEFPGEALASLPPGNDWVQGLLTIGTASATIAVLVEAHDLRFGSADDPQAAYNISSVVEQIAYNRSR